jgi:hypothetical protein
MLDGDSASATQLLTDYLLIHRRERSDPEWSLRNTTAADDAWQLYYAQRGVPQFTDIGRSKREQNEKVV